MCNVKFKTPQNKQGGEEVTQFIIVQRRICTDYNRQTNSYVIIHFYFAVLKKKKKERE